MLGSRITSKGQVTIPKDIRIALGLKAGDRVTFVPDGDRVLLFPMRGDILSLKGVLKPYFKGKKPMSVVEMRARGKKFVVGRYKDHRQGGK